MDFFLLREDVIEQIIAGGPPRDGIRSVDQPGFATTDEAVWVKDDTQVIGVEIDGDARAYPVHLLEYHQIVNDDFSGRPVVVTYDPSEIGTDQSIETIESAGHVRAIEKE